MISIPTPQEQVEFLQKVQRLLGEGLFVASYKFALLRALADLAVLKGDDTGNELTLSVDDIAAVFIDLYWRQARPFCAADNSTAAALRQNTGRQAAVVRSIAAAQAEVGGSLPRLRQDVGRWQPLVREVADVVAVMPLWKLQRVGEEVLDFLYPNVGSGRTITLRPGATYCLRAFYGILRNLVEGAWLNYVRTQNLQVLGQSTDLYTFLFGSERAMLEVYRPFLRDIQSDICFYCHQPLRHEGEADHFIPWSRYPVDLGHNFVLAHKGCNGHKSDHLAAEEHLEAWARRNEGHKAALNQFFEEARLPSDLGASLGIARWAYSQMATMNGMVWVKGEEMAHLGTEWQALLVEASNGVTGVGA